MQFSPLDLIAVVLFLVAFFGWLNLRALHLPVPVGLLAISTAVSLAIVAAERLFPSLGLAAMLGSLLGQINFSQAVLNFLLSFLMFAAGMSIDVGALRGTGWTAGVLATVGTVISTLLVGAAFYFVTGLFGLQLSFAWCLVFGALISPTDPAAMLASVKYVPLPRDVKALLQAESVFNDGIGIVLFTALLAAAAGSGAIDYAGVAGDVLVKGGGAVILGGAAALLAIRAMHKIDDYGVETALTIALATGIYALSQHFGLSGPIATATAGLLVGTDRASKAMSEVAQRYVRGFWNLVDEILNAVLFLLIGLEVVALEFDWRFVLPAICAIVLVLLARLTSVSVPAVLLARSRETIGYWIIPVLTWSGARGALSIALALMLPATPERALILSCTYAIVLFAIFVQSMSMPAFLRRLGIAEAPSERA
jgi:CPA1 family monovalent cation:H+ antiporter